MKRMNIVFCLFMLLSIALSAVPRDMCVVEIATGTWCTYCPGAAMGADDLILNRKRAAVVEYHNGDNYTNDYSNARNSWYGVTGFPTAYFDGGNAVVGGNHSNSMYSQYQSRVNARMNIPANYTITATGTQSGNIYNVAVTVTKVADDAETNLRLHGVLTESGIQYSWQGQTHLEFVERLMAPDQNGTALTLVTGVPQTVNLTFTALPAWNAEEFEFIFFLQNNTSKEVMQGCKYIIEGLENLSPVSDTSIDFGTMTLDDIGTHTFSINNWWTQDMNGEMSIDNDAFFVFPEVREPYSVPFWESADFTVFFTPNQPGTYNATLTITSDNPAYPNIEVPLTAVVTGTANQDETAPVNQDAFLTCVPNPFVESAALRYNLKSGGKVEIAVYNLKGERVANLSGDAVSGTGSLVWNGKLTDGSVAPSGMYFSTLKVNGLVSGTQKLIKLK